MLSKGDATERAWSVRQRQMPVEDVLHVDVVQASTQYLPQFHACLRRGADGFARPNPAALVDDDFDASELFDQWRVRIVQRDLMGLADRLDDVTQPRGEVAGLAEQQHLHRAVTRVGASRLGPLTLIYHTPSGERCQ